MQVLKKGENSVIIPEKFGEPKLVELTACIYIGIALFVHTMPVIKASNPDVWANTNLYLFHNNGVEAGSITPGANTNLSLYVTMNMPESATRVFLTYIKAYYA